MKYNALPVPPFKLVTMDYAVALQIEDFMFPTDIILLSSVPVQFVVRVRAFPFIVNQSLL